MKEIFYIQDDTNSVIFQEKTFDTYQEAFKFMEDHGKQNDLYSINKIYEKL